MQSGVDIIEVKRISKAINRWGANFLKRIFTIDEIDLGQSKANPDIFYAARFAAKEAVYKTLSDEDQKNVWFTDIQILNSSSGKPIVYFRNHENSYEKTQNIDLSLSHTKSHAVALAFNSKTNERN